MSEEKKIFDQKFVHFIWDDSLEGKDGFFATDIATLEVAVEDNNSSTFGDSIYGTLSRGAKKLPFHSDLKNKDWLFFYYDPNYDVKLAWKQGKMVQYKSVNGNWYDAKYPSWDDDTKYRVKPEKKWRPFKDVQELKQTWLAKNDAKSKGDLYESFVWVRFKVYRYASKLIVGFDKKLNKVCVAGTWFNLSELHEHCEFLDGTPLGVEAEE